MKISRRNFCLLMAGVCCTGVLPAAPALRLLLRPALHLLPLRHPGRSAMS